MVNPPRHVKGGYVDPKKLPKGPNGRALCRQCQTETKPPRKTFCSQKCVDLWMVRTGSKMAAFIKKRDKGICALCGLDCEALKKELRKLYNQFEPPPFNRPSEVWNEECNLRYQEYREVLREANKNRNAAIKAFKEKHGIAAHRSRFWDIDHIVPVVQGGGSCDPSNLRSLCIPCHKKVTNDLRQRLKRGKPQP